MKFQNHSSSRRKEAHFKMRASLRRLLLVIALGSTCVHAATNSPVAPVPVPSSPYLPRIYRYVDVILENPTQTTNLHHHQNSLRLLYTLSELSTKPKYRDAADAALRTWLEKIPSPDEPITRPWMLWNRCFDIAREPSTKFALGVIKNQITNHPGFYLRTCSAAYAHTTNELFLRAIETFLDRFEASKAAPSLSLGIDCDGCARLVPEPLAGRLRALAQRPDNTPEINATPQTAMMYVSRYENTGKTSYRDAVHAAANASLKFSPPDDVSPAILGEAISLQLAAWRSTARQAHLDKARALADLGLTKFFGDPPELIHGVDTLALATVELHLHVLYITAVRYPPNTIDR
jgi:hypothetical protein